MTERASDDKLVEMLAACEDYIANHVADFDDDPHADPVGDFNPYAIRELITELLASRSWVEGREAVIEECAKVCEAEAAPSHNEGRE